MKTILFRFSIALSAFLIGLGFFCGWLFLSKSNQPAKIEVAEWQDFEPQIANQTVNSEIEETYDEGLGFDKEGFYYIIGETSKDFSDFNEFYLQIWDYNEKAEDFYLIKPTGYLLKNEKEVKFKKLFLGQRTLSFETQATNGISYQFTGKFAEKVTVFEEDRVLLEGTLRKLKNGKKIAEKEFKFGWYVDGC